MKKETKGFLKEFKDFILRGNVMDLAVAVIIGGAFQKIIASLVDDIIMPVISLVTGGTDFNNWFLSLDGTHYKTLSQAKEAGAATLNYGTFLTAILNFLIMAFVIFIFVKAINGLTKKLTKPAEKIATMKTCPYCISDIPVEATRCGFCTSTLDE